MSVGVSFAVLNTMNRLGPRPSSSSSGGGGGGSGGSGGGALAFAGLELGMWLYFGDTLLLLGLQSTTAIRAAIFSQLSTVLVPLLDSAFFSRERIPKRLWLSCAASLLGVALVSCDGGGEAAVTEAIGTAGSAAVSAVASTIAITSTDTAAAGLVDQLAGSSGLLSHGDVLAVLSAVFTSIYLIRLSHHSGRTADSVGLSSAMSTTELGLAVLSLGAVCATPVGAYLGLGETNSLDGVLEYLRTATTSPSTSGQTTVALAVLWNGACATALANAAMTYGQRDTSPAVSNVVYSFQPVFAAAFSYLILGETVGPLTAAGSVLLVGAILFVFSSPNMSDSDQSDPVVP